MGDADEEGYVHDPETFREEVGEREEERTAGSSGPGDALTTRAYAGAPREQSFDWRGWLLVGALFVAFLVVPLTILFLPEARPVIRSLGLSFRDAYLVLPLVPALVLGALAVWTAVSARRNA